MNILMVGAKNQIAENFFVLAKREIPVEDCSIWFTYYSKDDLKCCQKLYEGRKNLFFDIRRNRFENTSVHFDAIVVSAWSGTEKADRDNKFLQYQNVNALFDFLTQLNTRKIILLGSQAEYGLHHGVVNEETEEKPNNFYGMAKRCLYNKMREFCGEKQICLVELRIHSCYGVKDNDSRILHLVISRLLQDETVRLQSNCEQYWDFVYSSDVARAILLIVLNDVESGVYNISSGEKKRLRDYFIRVKMIVGKGNIIFGKETSQGVPDFIFDSEKIRDMLGWYPCLDFDRGIELVVNCLKQKEKW